MDRVNHLARLESQSVFVLREAYANLNRLAMLWSVGKDSTVMLWLARKAFGGQVPFPIIHVDTSFKIPEMITFRDRIAADWELDLRVHRNEEALADGMNPEQGRVTCCQALKTGPVKAIVDREGYGGLIVGVRRDEQGTRAKERYFSPRSSSSSWDLLDQPPEFWAQYNTEAAPGEHFRIHPLLDWTEIDVWRYVEQEGLPVSELYSSRDGQRYRSLGCAPCTATVESGACTVSEIVAELESTRVGERDGRAQDQESEDAFERLRTDGYM